MISQSREHLRQAGESYWQHFRFATTFGLLAVAAGLAAMLHAFCRRCAPVPLAGSSAISASCSSDRSKIDAVESEAVEARAFVLLLILASAVVVAPLWLLDVPTLLRFAYTVLAFALPAALLFSNPELMRRQAGGRPPRRPPAPLPVRSASSRPPARAWIAVVS